MSTIKKYVIRCYEPYLLVIFCLACSQPETVSKPPYFVAESITAPAAFQPEIITTTNGISFSPDGTTLYISKNIEDTFSNGRTYAAIFNTQYLGNEWSKPEQVDFGFPFDAYHPVLTHDGKHLFFNSRSHPDSGNVSIPHDIWQVTKRGTDWVDLRIVPGINSTGYDSYPSVAKNGNLYFNSNRSGGQGGMDFYLSKYENGQYQTPINLASLNSPDEENDLVVDPEERFIIFNRYLHETRSVDLFISLRKKENWTDPRLIDNISDPDKWELTPSLSPDGKYFFYELDNTIMQIDLAAIIFQDELPEIGNRPTSEAP